MARVGTPGALMKSPSNPKDTKNWNANWNLHRYFQLCKWAFVSLSFSHQRNERENKIIIKKARKKEREGGGGVREISREERRMDRETRFREERRGEVSSCDHCTVAASLSLSLITISPPYRFSLSSSLFVFYFFFKIFLIKKWLEFAFTTKRNATSQLVWKNI